jgi:hypothetical protein
MSTILEYNPNENIKSNPTEEIYVKPSNLEEEFSSYYKFSGNGTGTSFPTPYLILLSFITLLVGFWLLWKMSKSRRQFIQSSGNNFY